MNIGIKTPNNMFGINIRPGSFTIVDEDDVDYLMSTTTLLSKGWLQVEEKKKTEVLEKMGIDETETSAFMSDEEIMKKLNSNGRTLEKWLNDITDPMQLDRIANLAVGMNLSMNKIKILQAKIPGRDLMDE
jgi:hypothetical protein